MCSPSFFFLGGGVFVLYIVAGCCTKKQLYHITRKLQNQGWGLCQRVVAVAATKKIIGLWGKIGVCYTEGEFSTNGTGRWRPEACFCCFDKNQRME
jgi:hypothetical protein